MGTNDTTSSDHPAQLAAALDFLRKARHALGLPEMTPVEDLDLDGLKELRATAGRIVILEAVRIYACEVLLGQMLLKAQGEHRQAPLIRELEEMMNRNRSPCVARERKRSLVAAKEAKRLRELANVTLEQLAHVARLVEVQEPGT